MEQSQCVDLNLRDSLVEGEYWTSTWLSRARDSTRTIIRVSAKFLVHEEHWLCTTFPQLQFELTHSRKGWTIGKTMDALNMSHHQNHHPHHSPSWATAFFISIFVGFYTEFTTDWAKTLPRESVCIMVRLPCHVVHIHDILGLQVTISVKSFDASASNWLLFSDFVVSTLQSMLHCLVVALQLLQHFNLKTWTHLPNPVFSIHCEVSLYSTTSIH